MSCYAAGTPPAGMLQPPTKRVALDILWPHSVRGSKEIGFMMLIVLIGLACASLCCSLLPSCASTGSIAASQLCSAHPRIGSALCCHLRPGARLQDSRISCVDYELDSGMMN